MTQKAENDWICNSSKRSSSEDLFFSAVEWYVQVRNEGKTRSNTASA